MAYLRFTVPEFQAVCRVCYSHDLFKQSPEELRDRLAGALACEHPEFADRISKLNREEQLVLHQFLLEQQQPPDDHRLTARELWVASKVFGPLVFKARFRGPLLQALVVKLRDSHPDLAAKLYRMGNRDLDSLWEQLLEREEKDA